MDPTTPPPGATAAPQPPAAPAPPARSPRPVTRRGPRRTRPTRSATDRVIGGVAGGLGRHLGVDAALVRMAFVVLAFAGGVGILAYGVAWALLPPEGEQRLASEPRRPATVQQGVALGLITLGLLLLLREMGLWLGDAIVWPITLAAAGSAVIWAQGDEQSQTALDRLRRRLPGRGQALEAAAAHRVSPARVIIGTVLVGVSIAGFLAANEAIVAARSIALALVAAVVGAALLFGPWLWRLATELSVERRERIRQEERAELAAHLHDSVLQTLALIQRSADQPRRMVALARRQERELRSWLYASSGDPGSATTLADAVETIAEEIEAVHDLSVEVVVVGDAPVDDHVRALLAATREAAVNAAKHAEVTAVDVYVEVERDEVIAYIRDRGRGFDPAAVDGDRQGIRSSIIDRVERHGGRATVWSEPGNGTEVELSVPLRRRQTTQPARDPAPTIPEQDPQPRPPEEQP